MPPTCPFLALCSPPHHTHTMDGTTALVFATASVDGCYTTALRLDGVSLHCLFFARCLGHAGPPQTFRTTCRTCTWALTCLSVHLRDLKAPSPVSALASPTPSPTQCTAFTYLLPQSRHPMPIPSSIHIPATYPYPGRRTRSLHTTSQPGSSCLAFIRLLPLPLRLTFSRLSSSPLPYLWHGATPSHTHTLTCLQHMNVWTA